MGNSRTNVAAILSFLLPAIASAAVAQIVAQGTLSLDPKTRCAQLVAFWQLHGGSKSEGSGGADIARKSAEVDCGAGRYERGIRTMEDLLRRNGYTVPSFSPGSGG
jgi:hypothetical protein